MQTKLHIQNYIIDCGNFNIGSINTVASKKIILQIRSN